jgi:hypothetical protein
MVILGLLGPEDGGSAVLQNADNYSPVSGALHTFRNTTVNNLKYNTFENVVAVLIERNVIWESVENVYHVVF